MTKKISLISDIHLECTNHYNIELDDSSILILGGDILNLKILHNPVKDRDYLDRLYFLEFLNKVSTHYEHVIFIAGNHEFYGSEFMSLISETQCLFDKNFGNIYFLERNMKVIDDVVFICGSLWTDMDCFSKEKMGVIKWTLADYKVIRSSKNENVLIEPEETAEYHYDTLEDFSVMLSAAKKNHPEKPVVVCTHHAPSKESVHQKFEGSVINAAFVSDLKEFIELYDNIAVWTHGHVHDPVDYTIHNTRVLCNPRGYDSERPNEEVQPLQFGV